MNFKSLTCFIFMAIFSLQSLSTLPAEPNEDVMKLTLPREDLLQQPDVASVCNRLYQACQKQAHYLLSTIHPWEEDENLLLLTESKSGEHWIRPNTNTIAGFAFLYRFGEYDASIVGIERDRLLNEYILPMIQYITTTHLTGSRPTSDGKKWGDAWQSAHWAHMLARGAWWIWDDLPQEVQQDIRRVIRHEAERIANSEPPHQIKQDTKAEENAWNSQILSVAMLLMPNDPRRPVWEEQFQKWVLSSFLRPADKNSNQIIDGKPVSKQFTGANIYDDFTLENHGIVHPDYMTCFTLTMGNLLDYKLTGRQAPEAIFYNAHEIYENLTWFSLPDGGYVYPSGQDWRLFRNPDWLKAHIMMAVYMDDPNAWQLFTNCLDTLEKMQARSNSGQIYLPEEYFFASTQHDIFYGLAQVWLHLHCAKNIVDDYQPKKGVLRLDRGKIILNRTDHAIHTFSWGAKQMAQCLANRRDRIVSPHQHNGLDRVVLKDQNEALSTEIRDVKVTHNDKQFSAQLEIIHGNNQARSALHYQSNPDGVFTINDTLTAMKTITTSEIQAGWIGILNNPKWVYENGQRTLHTENQTFQIEALRGEKVNANAKQFSIDQTLFFESESPLPLFYQAANQYHRARVTDLLFLNHIKNDKIWVQGDVISEYKVKIWVE